MSAAARLEKVPVNPIWKVRAQRSTTVPYVIAFIRTGVHHAVYPRQP
jgi:hypothetical protein